MIASLNAELLKMRKRLANWISIGILLALIVLVVYVISFFVLRHPPPGFRTGSVPASELIRVVFPENLVPTVLSNMISLGAAIMLIVGALAAASEYGWLTVQTILVQRPGRLGVLAGKVLALGLLVTLVTLALYAAAAATSAILVAADGRSSAFPAAALLARGIGATWLVLAVWTGFGMFLGIAFRSTAGAIGGGLVYLLAIETLLQLLFTDTPGIKEVLKLLPGVNANGLLSAFPPTVAEANRAAPLVTATHGWITLLVYLALFVVIAGLVFQRRDVAA